jgi:membrane-bound metal-dependent hydrolase YbcI (DUF457 family)
MRGAGLPFTPLHYPVAYVLSKLDRRLRLTGLIVGSMFPDFEIPIIILLGGGRIPYNRLVLHSLVGAATIGTLSAVAFTVVLYPVLISTVFRVPRDRVVSPCRWSPALAVSCLVGCASHALLDVVTHPANPILWPIQPLTSSPVAEYTLPVSLVVHLVLAAVIAAMLIVHRRHPWDRLLLGEPTSRVDA